MSNEKNDAPVEFGDLKKAAKIKRKVMRTGRSIDFFRTKSFVIILVGLIYTVASLMAYREGVLPMSIIFGGIASVALCLYIMLTVLEWRGRSVYERTLGRLSEAARAEVTGISASIKTLDDVDAVLALCANKMGEGSGSRREVFPLPVDGGRLG